MHSPLSVGQRAAIAEILRTAGTISATSQDLLDITGPEFSMAGHTDADKRRILEEQTRVANEFTKAEFAWNPSQTRFSSSIAYFGNGNAAIRQNWQELRTAVNAARQCASDMYRRWYLAGQGIGSYVYNTNYCQQQLHALDDKAARLGETFGLQNDQRGWDNPSSLKQKLNISD